MYTSSDMDSTMSVQSDATTAVGKSPRQLLPGGGGGGAEEGEGIQVKH